MVLQYRDILLDMKEWLAIRLIKACSSVIAMVLIWRIVETALNNGINGVLFFGGVAAIAGLGGYEIRWLVNAVRSRTSSNK